MNTIREKIEPYLLSSVALLFPLYSLYWAYNNFTLISMLMLYFLVLYINIHRTVFLHRIWCHKAKTTNKLFTIYGLIVITLHLVGNSIVWTATHRQHHRYSDTENDPIHGNKLRIQFFAPFSQFNMKYAVDLIRDPLHVWFAKYYWHINIMWFILLYLINPAYLGLWIAAIGIAVFKMNLVNTVSHDGNGPVNRPVLAYIFLDGEFWHKNHHDNQNSISIGNKPYQIDLGKQVAKLV